MNLDKSLCWIDDNNGWNDFDTGFCNRVVNWEVAYYLKEKFNEDHQILLDREQWPEINDFIFLPNTTLKSNLKHVTEKSRSILISPETIFDFNNEKHKISNTNHIYYVFDYEKKDINNENQTPKFVSLLNKEYYNKIRPLSHIKIKNHLIEDFLIKLTKDVVGIHIRRGNGVTYENDDLVDLPTSVKNAYIEYRKIKRTDNCNYFYIKDRLYYDIIDNILKINPSQKFYISTDLPYGLISYYKEKYGDNIILKDDIINKINQFLEFTNDSIDGKDKKITVFNMVDLFALSFCKFMIKSTSSTWSNFASLYRNQPFSFPENSILNIIKLYKSIPYVVNENVDVNISKKLF